MIAALPVLIVLALISAVGAPLAALDARDCDCPQEARSSSRVLIALLALLLVSSAGAATIIITR